MILLQHRRVINRMRLHLQEPYADIELLRDGLLLIYSGYEDVAYESEILSPDQ